MSQNKIIVCLKKQEEELNDFYEFLNPALKAIIKSYNAKIIKAVCDEMTGKENSKAEKYSENYHDTEMCDKGYNFRVQEEIEKAKEIIKI